MMSKHVATLTEYMTQPVSQYSLFSFHDAEESTNINNQNSKKARSRRWLVRRLSTEEAQGYISSAASSEDDEIMEEANLFRLAVPLLPLIGWDLTPVIDLEVIPPKNNNRVEANLNNRVSIDKNAKRENGETDGIYESLEDCEQMSTSSSKWEPLRGIRKHIRNHGDGTNSEAGNPAVVKIRSLRVSLLSTQEEVKEVMSNNNGRQNQRSGSDMQKEALQMVGKVEEWLRPHITFEAELSWNDGVSNSGIAENESSSTVTVKSTAITSLTIPKIPSEILRKSIPSSFVVKRLGATLTSQALAICLPRFLRQLEKDYNRWSGLGLNNVDSDEKNEGISPNSD